MQKLEATWPHDRRPIVVSRPSGRDKSKLEFTWHILGTYLKHPRNLEDIRNMLEVYWEHTWNVLGIYLEHPRIALGYAWAISGMHLACIHSRVKLYLVL